MAYAVIVECNALREPKTNGRGVEYTEEQKEYVRNYVLAHGRKWKSRVEVYQTYFNQRASYQVIRNWYLRDYQKRVIDDNLMHPLVCSASRSPHQACEPHIRLRRFGYRTRSVGLWVSNKQLVRVVHERPTCRG